MFSWTEFSDTPQTGISDKLTFSVLLGEKTVQPLTPGDHRIIRVYVHQPKLMVNMVVAIR